MLINKIKAFIKRDFAIETSYRLSFLLRLGRIFTTVFTFYFISKLFGKGASAHLQEYGGKYFPFVLIGIAFSEYLMVSLRSFSQIMRREQMMGTLEAMLATPTGVPTIIAGASVWNFLFASFSIFIYLLVGEIFLGAGLNSANLFSAFIIFILTVVSFSAIGIISAAFILILKKGDPLTWFIGMGFGLLGGVYFPVSIMPRYLQALSFLLPITYSLRGLRLAIIKGYGVHMLLPEIGALFIFCVLLFPAGIFIFKFALKKAKIDGSLAYY